MANIPGIRARLLVLVWLAAVVLAAAAPVRAAAPTELFFSEYIEGNSNNKALEIYNGTGAAIDLATGGYNIQMYFNGSTSPGLTINLTGTVAAGDVYVVAHSSADPIILAQADQTNGAGWFNGDDAVVLRKGTAVVDVIGQIGFDPGTEWGTGLASTADNTLRRVDTICAGDSNGADVFDPSLEWDGFATNTFGGLGAHTANCAGPDVAPEVMSTYPVNGATDFPTTANISVTFSEPVNVGSSWFSLTCSASGAVTGAVSGGPTTFTIDPAVDLVAGESCALAILASQVSDQDTNDPPDNMVFNFDLGFTVLDVCTLPYTPIYAIQGSGATTPMPGLVSTKGVVVGDYEGASPALRGFFIQDATGDGDPATSDGLFVFNGDNNRVNLGDVVRVTGTATEFQGQTQIGSVTAIANCGTGSVDPVDVTFPVPAPDFLERYEGMLVRLPQTLYVTDNSQLGRFGEVVLTASETRLPQPTDIVLPGEPAIEMQTANSLNRIILDDDLQNQNPDPIVFARGGQPLSAANTLRGGDTATDVIGVLNYTWAGNSASPNAYRVRPINALGGSVEFVEANTRPSGPPAVGGLVRVASMNVLNYFNTFADRNPATPGCFPSGTDADCRGANSQAEFDRQVAKTVAAILQVDADVLGLIELENDGYGTASAIQDLVDRLNEATAPGTYAFVDADGDTGQANALGTDAIKVGLIYKPAIVNPGATAVLNTVAFVNGGDGAPRNRPALAKAFTLVSNGEGLVVAVNHFKSKGSACDVPDAGDGQGNCNEVRVAAARELAAWLAADPTGAGHDHVLVVGDLNSYTMEDPLRALADGGYINLPPALGTASYSYSFDAQWGTLDHALASPGLLGSITGARHYHINADEPGALDYNVDFKSAGQIASLYAPDEFRIADHDPVLVGMTLVKPIDGTDRRDDLTGTPGPDRIYGGRGGDTLTGGGGPDVFVYLDIRDANDTITDFNPAEGDLIDLSAILRGAGYSGTDPIADGWLRVLPADSKFMVQVDLDGPGPMYDFRQLLVVKGPPKGYVFTKESFVF